MMSARTSDVCNWLHVDLHTSVEDGGDIWPATKGRPSYYNL